MRTLRQIGDGLILLFGAMLLGIVTAAAAILLNLLAG